MALNTTTSKVGGVFVVYLSGAIFFGEESASLRNLRQVRWLPCSAGSFEKTRSHLYTKM